MHLNSAGTAATLTQNWAGYLQAGHFLEGPEWLRELRAGAAEQFLSGGLPGNKDEAWKYTSLRRLEDLSPSLNVDVTDSDRGQWKPILSGVSGFGFRFGDGKLHWLEQEIPSGVTMMSLAEACSQEGNDFLNQLRPLLEAVDLSGRSRAFEALNTALLHDGVIIRVAAGVDAGSCQVHWARTRSEVSRLDNFRLIIILESGARLHLLEQFNSDARAEPAGESRGQALNVVLQAQLADDAEFHHVRLQSEASENVLMTFSEVQQAQRSNYVYTGFDIGGGLVRHSLKCRLTGQGARAEVNGAFVLDHQRHVDHQICVDHVAPSCHSEQFFRGVLGGHGRGVFNGKARIQPGADGSIVRQSNANLLLSEFAEIDTKPELEIYADEVEASHGATVGSLDEQAVFYLRSRGIQKSAARGMLTSAFCRQVANRLPDAGMAEQIVTLLDASIPGIQLDAEGPC